MQIRLYTLRKFCDSQTLELLLDLGEAQFDWVQLTLVHNVEYGPDPQLLHLCTRSLCTMRRQIVHEQGDCSVAICLSHLLEVLDELVLVNRLLEYLALLRPSFLRYAHQQTHRLLVQELLVDLYVLVFERPLTSLYCPPCEHSLVDEDDLVSLLPCLVNLLLQLLFEQRQLGLQFWWHNLLVLNGLLLDATLLVDLAQQGRVHPWEGI